MTARIVIHWLCTRVGRALVAVGLALCIMSRPCFGASPCPAGDGPWVAIVFVGEPWSEAFRQEILAHLRAGLSRDDLLVCAEGARATEPIAHVVLSRDSVDSVGLTIDVQDGITKKRVVRDVDLGAVPADAKTLGIAVATDELLRASWVELALEDAPRPETPPPPAVKRAVEEKLQDAYRPSPRRFELGMRGAFEHYGGGQDQLGGEGVLRAWLSPSIGVEVAMGLRRAFTVDTEAGSVTGSTIGGSASFVWKAIGTDPLSVQLEAGPSLSQVRLRGDATAGAVGEEGSAIAAFLRAGAALGWRAVSSFGLRVRGGGGVPVSSVAARSDGRTVTAVSGAELYAGLEAHAIF